MGDMPHGASRCDVPNAGGVSPISRLSESILLRPLDGYTAIRDHEDVATSKASEKTTLNAQETTSHTQELSQMAQETGVNAQDLSTRLFVERGEHSCSGIVGIRLDFTIHDVSCFVHGGFRLGIVAGLANVEGQAALHDRLVQENVYSFCERHAQACKD